MKKKRIVIIAVIVCVAAAILALYGYHAIKLNQIKTLLELGNQYLEEEQYEEAIAAYKQVLSIEPKEKTARENIVVAAVDWSDDLVENHEYDRAEEMIADIYSIVPDERLEKQRQLIIRECAAYEQELLEIERKEKERQQALEQISVVLDNLAQLCADGDTASVYSYLGSDEYQAVIGSEYVAFGKKYETDYGTLGLYENGMYVYFGDYDGEMRSGNGDWYAPSTKDTSQYIASGSWSNDKPNGEQVEKYLSDQQGMFVMKGSVVDGLWDGVVSFQFPRENMELFDFPVTFHNGVAEIVETNEHGNFISIIYGDDGFPIAKLLYNDSYQGIWGFGSE